MIYEDSGLFIHTDSRGLLVEMVSTIFTDLRFYVPRNYQVRSKLYLIR